VAVVEVIYSNIRYMRIKEAVSSADKKAFLKLPKKIYKDCPNWIQPLNKDIEAVFDPKINRAFNKGKCKRWLLFNSENEVIGRVATFVNKKYKQAQPTGGIGFFEIIEDKEAAFFLLDHCQEWLKEQGMEAMDGPINFGERDQWWGLLIKGFHEPLYRMNYNPPYYVDFFEDYGFKVYFKQLCFGMKVTLDLQSKFFERHHEISQNPAIRADNVKKKNLEKYARDFAHIYNKAWAQHGDGKSMDERVAIKLFQSMKPVLDESIAWMVYHKEEPIACWINLPDLNFYFKRLNGKFDLFHKLKFLWYKKTISCPKFTGIVFGVIPEWQKSGVDYYMIVESVSRFISTTSYRDYEMQWIGDFNPKMINIAKSLGAEVTRELATYRYLFDREKEFERHPIV